MAPNLPLPNGSASFQLDAGAENQIQLLPSIAKSS